MITALLIVTVVGVGGPPPRAGTPQRPAPLGNGNATVFVQSFTPSHSLPSRKTDKHGRAVFHLGPNRYQVSAVLENSSPALRCQERTVTMTGTTQRVRLACQIS